LDTTADLVAKNLLDQSVKSEKLSILVSNNTTNLSVVKPDAKKLRLSGSKPLKKKKKSMKTKKKSSVMSKKKTTTSTSSLADCLTSTKFEFNESNLLNKTPAKLNLTRLNSIMESNSKTIKAEPKRQLSIHASGKVKQMVELVEARMKTTSMQNTPSTVVKQQQQQQSKQPQIKSKLSNTSTLNSVAKKLRSSIDERKKRISNSKIENKRQSSKRVNAFLNDLVQQKTAVTVAPAETKTNNVKKKLNYQEIKQEPIDHDTELTKPLPPTTQIINNTTTTTTTTATTSSNNGLAHLLATSTTIQQNYKLKYTSSLNSDTKKQSLAATTTTTNNNKFLERNTTPCKSKELEEKRKIELIYKEEKEQKRLQEREKLLHEKIETAKK